MKLNISFFLLMFIFYCWTPPTFSENLLCHNSKETKHINEGNSFESYESVKNFTIYDGTLYRNKPYFYNESIKPITIAYENDLWPKGVKNSPYPDPIAVRALSKRAASRDKLLAIDIEHWRLSTQSEAKMNIPNYLNVAKQFKIEEPSLKLGFFGMFPLPDYTRGSMHPESYSYKNWQKDNERLKQIADAVDVIFPEAYTPRSINEKQWVKYAIAIISEARKFAKPVYVFLWPQYYDKEKPWQYLPEKYWELQLETGLKHADGIVIWGGYDFEKRDYAIWNDTAEWWIITKKFIERIQKK